MRMINKLKLESNMNFGTHCGNSGKFSHIHINSDVLLLHYGSHMRIFDGSRRHYILIDACNFTHLKHDFLDSGIRSGFRRGASILSLVRFPGGG